MRKYLMLLACVLGICVGIFSPMYSSDNVYTTTKCILDATKVCEKCVCCTDVNDQCCCLHVDKCTCPPGRKIGERGCED